MMRPIMFAKEHSRFWRVMAAGLGVLLLGTAVRLSVADEPALKELKDKVENARIADRPALCLQIAERQLGSASRLYVAGDSEQAKAALADVVSFSEQASNYAIQSHKHEKQSEITIRKMTRKLADLKHTVTHEEQQDVQTAIERLQRIRDDLLGAMFPKVGNK
jgi:hypothetical protein